MKFKTHVVLIFPVPAGHAINLPGQALNMQNICTFGNYKTIELPGKFKTVHAFLKLWKKWIIGQALTHFKTKYLKYKFSVSIL